MSDTVKMVPLEVAEMAAEVSRLEAENERLRAALEPIRVGLRSAQWRFVDGVEQHGGVGSVRGKRIILAETAVDRIEAAFKER